MARLQHKAREIYRPPRDGVALAGSARHSGLARPLRSYTIVPSLIVTSAVSLCVPGIRAPS